MISAALSGLVAGYGIAVPVGAIAVLLLTLSARTSWRVGAAAGLGAASIDGSYALAAVVGGTELAGLTRVVAAPLHWAASGTLAIMAARTVAVAVGRYRSAGPQAPAGLRLTSPLRAYAALAGLTALNPLTVVYFGALVLHSQAAGAFTAARAGIFVACVFVASASWQLLLATGGTLLGRVVTGRRGMLALALLSAALITLLAF